jgi:hypothetical protein
VTNPEKVYDFFKKNSHKWICDDCVEKSTGVDRQEIKTIAATLALFPNEFHRTSTICVNKCSNRDKRATQAI